jgi:hypothetical protein
MQKINATVPTTLSDSERQTCEIWTRVMGYHRPVSLFNLGKQGEFNERKFFEESTFTPLENRVSLHRKR